MLLYMPYHNCKYLYLSNDEATKSAAKAEWSNIPTLSQSSRECYITAVKLNLVFSANQSHTDIIVKGSLPTMNYTTTDNGEPVLAVITSTENKTFDLNIENPIHLLSNDNIKNFAVTFTHSSGTAITATPIGCNVILKIEYLDQDKQTESYLSEVPKHL